MSGQVGPLGPRRNSLTQKQRGPSTVKKSVHSSENGNASKPSSPPVPQSFVTSKLRSYYICICICICICIMY